MVFTHAHCCDRAGRNCTTHNSRADQWKPVAAPLEHIKAEHLYTVQSVSSRPKIAMSKDYKRFDTPTADDGEQSAAARKSSLKIVS